MIRVLKDQPGLESLSGVTFEVEFEAICSVPMKPYGGKATIFYVPGEDCGGKRLIEWNSVQEWLRDLREEVCTAEQLACFLADTLKEKARADFVRVILNVTSPFHLPVSIQADSHDEECDQLC